MWLTGFLIVSLQSRAAHMALPLHRMPQWSALASDGIKMRLSEIERIAKAAMDACAEVINHPMDSLARERLFNSLAELVDPAFFETDQSRRDSFQPSTSAGERVGNYRPAAD